MHKYFDENQILGINGNGVCTMIRGRANGYIYVYMTINIFHCPWLQPFSYLPLQIECMTPGCAAFIAQLLCWQKQMITYKNSVHEAVWWAVQRCAPSSCICNLKTYHVMLRHVLIWQICMACLFTFLNIAYWCFSAAHIDIHCKHNALNIANK